MPLDLAPVSQLACVAIGPCEAIFSDIAVKACALLSPPGCFTVEGNDNKANKTVDGAITAEGTPTALALRDSRFSRNRAAVQGLEDGPCREGAQV